MRHIPAMIKNARSAYIDTSVHDNFFIAETDNEYERKVNILVFNKDRLGNYIVTAKKIDKSDLHKKEYKQVGAGVAPAITR